MKKQSLAGAWEFRLKGDEAWLPAVVPGGVHTDLLALEKIPDPFVGDNERKVQWVAESDWEYRRVFTADPDLLQQPQVWLVCDGLDTLASVCINGIELGQAENMFRQYRWDVKALLIEGANDLQINFDSAVRYIRAKQAERPMAGVSQAIQGGPYLRKAPCQFGWDWGPQLPPVGIWKDIRLEGYQHARLDHVQFVQHHEEDHVRVEVLLEVQRWSSGPFEAAVRIASPGGMTYEGSMVFPSGSSGFVEVEIPDPKLWWPNGSGEQPLYDVEVMLQKDGKLIDRCEYRLGLRTIELRQQPDEWGRSFTFVVNGLPVFAKGSNWIPADSFSTRISDEYLEGLIRAAEESHQNMLRVWGGGFYEEDRFYELCDRYGILVWQDFIFSCSVYPLDEEAFLENVRVEVVENIRRLRHHASLALWCGNNEMEWGWVDWGWTAPEYRDMQEAYDNFFHHTLPEWCAAEDPEHAYWPSSPSSDTPFEDPNGQVQGDAHYWDVWHGRKPFTAYRDQFPRFMSEFGFQALPPLETIRSYADEADWNMTSYIMERHQKNDSGNALMVSQMLETFRLPKDFDSLVYLSLVLQAEGIRYGVEHWRRHPDRVSGTLYWQLNDCWPVASWSSLDYFGRWKALHYAARRFFAPLLLSIEDKISSQDLFLTSDLQEPWQGSVHWFLELLDGEVLKEGSTPVSVAPADVTPVCQLDFSSLLTDENRRDMVFVADLVGDGQVLARQTACFVPTKHLNLMDPNITAQMQLEQQLIHVSLISRSLARQVECSLEGADAVFSDNYFDLPAGRSVNVTFPLPAGWTEEQARAAFRVRSIYDSYAHGPEHQRS